MRDTARHLAQGHQALLLHDPLLRPTQVIVGLLQSAIELGLVGRQGDMLAHLPQEFALATAEAVPLLASRDENSEHFAFDQQRRRHHRTQRGFSQALGEWEWDLADIRLVDQLSAHATREAVLINFDACLLIHRKVQCQRRAV